MRIKKAYLKSYFFITFIPTIIIALFFCYYQYHNLLEKHANIAKDNTEELAETINTFALEISTNLSLLSDLATKIDEVYIQELLDVMHEKYPYAKAFFYATPEGKVYLASHPLDDVIDISFRSYFQQLMRTKETIIFFSADDAINNYLPLITVASPVLTREGEVQGVLIGDIPPISITNKRPSIHNHKNFVLKDDDSNREILDKRTDTPSIKTISRPLKNAPWTVFTDVEAVSKKEVLRHTAAGLFIYALITHLLYFIFQYRHERKKLALQKQSHKIKKMELVGTLAGTFAHEIRNPLTGIMGFIGLLKEKYQTEEDRRYLSVMEIEVTRINNIVGQFLVLGKPIVVNQKLYDIKEIVQEVLPIIESEASLYDVVTEIDLAPETLLLFCEKDHIKQLLLNLSKNAIQALQPGGQLTISIDGNKESIFISVSDNGCGISDEIKNLLFEPFFTTKEEDGTGLGLVVCKHVVDMYKGTIEVDSAPDQGTTFFITFPISN